MRSARHDLSAEDFPFTLQALNNRTGEVVWQREVTGPGPLYIPPLARQIGAPVKIRMIWPDGHVTEQEPP